MRFLDTRMKAVTDAILQKLYSVVQVIKFAPPLHHTLKFLAMLRNNVENYKLLITFAIYQ